MRETSEFVLNNLKEMVITFPQLKFAYQYDSFSRTHLVEVLPRNEFEENSKLQEKLFEVTKGVIDLSMTESTCWFTLDEELVSIDRVDHEFVGLLYNDSAIENDSLFSILIDYDIDFQIQGSVEFGVQNSAWVSSDVTSEILHQLINIRSTVFSKNTSNIIMSSIWDKPITVVELQPQNEVVDSLASVEVGESNYAKAA